MSTRFVVTFVFVFSFGALVWFGLSSVADDGRVTNSDGPRLDAVVTARGNGSCVVGVKHQHCYALTFEVQLVDGGTFTSTLDVNVEDRLAERVSVGRRVLVQPRDDGSVALDITALDR